MEACAICERSINDDEPKSQLRLKGCENINLTSQLRGDNIKVIPGQKVHQSCRRDYINPRSLKPAAENASNVTKRSLRFNEKKRGPDVFPVRTIEFRNNLEAICMTRKDEWAEAVQSRLQMAPADLHAADAVYHQQCSVNFRTGKMIPLSQASDNNDHKKSTPGRPKNSSSEEAFLKVVRFLEEGEEEQLTISDLVKEMERICGVEAYSSVYRKKKVIDHFGKAVVITDLNGNPNVVTLTHNVSTILQEFYDRPKIANEDDEKRHVILTAAKLIKADIKSIDSSFKSYYPSSEYISSTQNNLDYVPETLQLFLKEIFSLAEPKVKVAAVGQAIIQACRPKAIIAPLQIGLGVQMHHHFGSKFLIETLNNLGYCSSYKDVQKFEVNAASSSDRKNMSIDRGSFIQYVVDNVDHNLRTLDGHGTFHGMGIIAAVTPGMSRQKSIPRGSPTLQDVVDLAKINIAFYKGQNDNLSELKFEALKEIINNDKTWKVDFLSRSSWPLRSLRPSWSAMMYNVMTGTFPGKSSIIFLPMIDMNPSDTTCVYSTLHFVCKEAKKNNVNPIITFDQPRYWKALTIIQNESRDSPLKAIVLKL